jgi:regulatory protein YycI of two-component signal transduction system YycFG
MFKELLESNGIEVKSYEICEGYTYTQVDIFKKMPSGFATTKYSYKYLDNGTTRIEQACMQYCIENGVKLEWLKNEINDKICEFYETEFSYGITYKKEHSHEKEDILNIRKSDNKVIGYSQSILMPKLDKLIAAIYAHDIKIIAT